MRERVVEPRAHFVALIARVVAGRVVPALLAVFGECVERRPDRTAADVLAVEVAPRLGERVIAPGLERGPAVTDVGGHPIVGAFRFRCVADQRQVERSAGRVRHSACAQVKEVAVHVGGVTMHVIEPPRTRPIWLATPTVNSLTLGEVTLLDSRAQPWDVGRRPRRAIVPAVGKEPVPQNRQGLIGGQIRCASGIDRRSLVEPAVARLPAARRPASTSAVLIPAT